MALPAASARTRKIGVLHIFAKIRHVHNNASRLTEGIIQCGWPCWIDICCAHSCAYWHHWRKFLNAVGCDSVIQLRVWWFGTSRSLVSDFLATKSSAQCDHTRDTTLYQIWRWLDHPELSSRQWGMELWSAQKKINWEEKWGFDQKRRTMAKVKSFEKTFLDATHQGLVGLYMILSPQIRKSVTWSLVWAKISL